MKNSRTTTAADLLVEELQVRGVPFVATLNGHGLDPFYLASRRAGLPIIDVRNEQAAAYMAEVTGRLTRSVGVCAVSGGVAHVNALSGVANAWFDGAPMLLITGITPLQELGLGGFQDFNPVPVTAPLCKYARLVDVPERIPQFVHEAFAAATSGRPGPVHLALPMDVASTVVNGSEVSVSHVRSGEVRICSHGDDGLIEKAARMLKESVRPLLIAGSGLYYSRGEEALEAFCARQQIPTVVPIWDRGAVLKPDETFMGVIGAASGGPKLLQKADLIILAGAEFDYRVGRISAPEIHPDARVIRIHADPQRLRCGLEAHLSIEGAPGPVLAQLAEACQKLGSSSKIDWLAKARELSTEHEERCLAAAKKGSEGISGAGVVKTIQEVLTEETILLVDGGNIGQWFHQFLDRYPGHWLTCGASGVVGWGLPGSMAAKALYPDRPVILLSGDGSFTFTVAELECASRQGLNFVAVVADDEQWGITVTGQRDRYGDALYSDLGPTRLDQVAEGFNCQGIRVESEEDLVPAIKKGLTSEKPTVVHVLIVPGSPSGESRKI